MIYRGTWDQQQTWLMGLTSDQLRMVIQVHEMEIFFLQSQVQEAYIRIKELSKEEYDA
jgi:hypothetical protein